MTDPFETVDIEAGIYDIKANVNGGGFKGQSEAVRMGIARALVKLNEELPAEVLEQFLPLRSKNSFP